MWQDLCQAGVSKGRTDRKANCVKELLEDFKAPGAGHRRQNNIGKDDQDSSMGV